MKIFKRDRSKNNYTHPDHPKHIGLDYSHDGNPSNRLRVVTYNIQYAKKIRQAIQLIEDHKILCDADVFCLQEMDADGVQLLANDLGYNYVYYPAVVHPTSKRDFGNAVLSKWPILKYKKIILPYTDQNTLQRIAVMVQIRYHQRLIWVVCVHMSLWLKAEERRAQMKSLVDEINSDNKYYVIAGDFNTFTKKSYEAIIDPFMEKDFTLVTQNIAWSYKHWYILNKKTRLDHIFARGMRLIDTDKVMSKKPSDHYPVWAELELITQ